MTPSFSAEISIIAHAACLLPALSSKAPAGTPRLGPTRGPLARLTLVCLTTLLWMTAGVASAQWTDATSGPLGDTGHGFGVAWGDYDNDGDEDLYLANYDMIRNKLLRNDGGGVFVNATTGPLGGGGNTFAVAWGDYDNDGDLDLYVGNLGGANSLLRNDGGGTFVDVTSGPLGDTGNCRSVAWGDYDNDGDLDLYFANGDGFGGQNRLLRNDGGTWVNATSGPLGATRTYGVAWGDYDNDGDLDLYLVRGFGSSGEANKLLRNDGGGAFVDATSGPLGGTGSGSGVAWGDYDNDSDLDLYLANNDASKLLRNDGGGTFIDVTTGPLGDPFRSAAWGDYDSDGDLDLYLVQEGLNRLLRNDGGGAFVDDTSGPLGNAGIGRSAPWGDYDNDGDLDLYLVNDGPNKLFRNDIDTVTGNHWLVVKLVGTISNRSGIGARVRVVAGGSLRIEEVSGGSGRYSQNSLPAEFGLGASTTIDSLVVRWPSGIVQRVTGVGVDQIMTVIESSTTGVEVATAAPRESRLLRGVPNPFGSATRIGYELAADSPVRLRVFDINGRLVRQLENVPLQTAGRHETMWNGRDATGGGVPAGVYFYRLEAGSFEDTDRLVIVR